MSKILYVIVFLSLFLSACQTRQWQVELIGSSVQCGLFEETITVAYDVSSLPKMLQNKQQYDFSENVFIVVSAGQKPSKGYRFEMTGEQVLLNDNDVVLPLRLTEPQPGFLQAQIITSPCAILSVKRSDVDGYLDHDVEFVLHGEL